jgi:hypothetical protein
MLSYGEEINSGEQFGIEEQNKNDSVVGSEKKTKGEAW